MKAISIKQPWAHAIATLNKRIENRADKRGQPPMCSYRGEVLIHASKGCTKDHMGAAVQDMTARRLISQRDVAGLMAAPRGCIVARAVVVGRIEMFKANRVDDLRAHVTLDIDAEQVPKWSTELRAHEVKGVKNSSRLAPCWVIDANGPKLYSIASRLDLRWWIGGHGLVLCSVEQIAQPVECAGALGLWNVNSETLEECKWQKE